MGKLILCSGKTAKRPYYFSATDTKVYSIEELCYYMYNNIYIITEDIFTEKLALWLKEELEMEEISEKLLNLLENKNRLKDIVVSILCSADYYTEFEIKELISVMDEIYGMPLILREKVRADYCMRYGNYADAERTYHAVLESKDSAGLSQKEYGNIVHNIGVANIHIASFREAAMIFKEAYSRNQSEESLKAYLFSLKLGKYEKEFSEEIENYRLTEKSVEELLKEYKEKEQMAELTRDYDSVRELEDIKSEGRISEYYRNIDELIDKWKLEYRHGIL